MFRCKRIFAVLLMLSLLVLPGCSKPAAKEGVTLRMAGLQGLPMSKELVAGFQAKHPGVQFENVPLTNAGVGELTSLLKDGKVDILPGYAAVHLAEQLQPLDRFLQKDNFDLKPLGRLEDLSYNGRMFEMPFFLMPFVLQYNQDLVSQAGVAIPDKPMTWDEFRDTARKLTSGQGNDRIWGFHPLVISYSLEIYIRENATNEKWWNDATAVRGGYKLFAEMIWNDKSCPPAPALDEFGRPTYDPNLGFPAGKAALTIEQFVTPAQLSRGDLKLGATLLPVPKGKEAMGIARPYTLSIAGNSAHTEEAWQFLRYIAGPEGAAIIAKAGFIPAYRTPDTMALWMQAQPAPPVGLKPLATMPLRLLRDNDPTIPNHENEIIRMQAYEAFTGARSWEAAFDNYKSLVKTAQ